MLVTPLLVHENLLRKEGFLDGLWTEPYTCEIGLVVIESILLLEFLVMASYCTQFSVLNNTSTGPHLS